MTVTGYAQLQKPASARQVAVLASILLIAANKGTKDAIECKMPLNSPKSRYVARVRVSDEKAGPKNVTRVVYPDSANSANGFAVLSEGFEHLSYYFGRRNARDGQGFSERSQSFVLRRADSELSALMALENCEALSEHAALPVGFVLGENGRIFMVSLLLGKPVSSSDLTPDERREFCSKVIGRLASLHSSGLLCGGIDPEAVDFLNGAVKITNASGIYAMDEDDTTFFDVAATLRALAGKGFAKMEDLPGLALEYMNYSPICRQGILEYTKKKKKKGAPHLALAATAKKYFAYL